MLPRSTVLQVGDKQEWVAPERLKAHAGAAEVQPAEPRRRGRPPKTNN